jgi:hypothetical protein
VQIHRRSRCTAGRALRRRRRCRRARLPMVYPGELHKPNRSPRRVSISFSVVSRRLLWLHRRDGGERSCPQGRGYRKTRRRGHVIIEFGFCDGSRSPLSHMAYFQAVQSRASRHAWKSASVRFDKKHAPGGLEIGAGLVKRGGGTALMFARMRGRIEAAIPAPRILVVRDADTDCNRTDLHIAVIDVRACFGSVSRSAAGEGGHAPLSKRVTSRLATRVSARNVLQHETVWSLSNHAFCRNQFAAASRTARPRCLVGAGFIPRLETLYRYAGRFGSPHHIGGAVAAGERNNRVRLPSHHLLVSDRSCRAPVGFPISMADVPLNLRLGRRPLHCELICSRRSTLHQFLLVQPVERTKDLRRASEIPSSANQDLHGYRHPNSGSAARATSWSIREVRRSTRLGSTKTPR